MDTYIDISGIVNSRMINHKIISVDRIFFDRIENREKYKPSLYCKYISSQEYDMRHQYIYELKRRIIESFRDEINNYFNLSLSSTQIDTICGFWFSYFLFNLYDKYCKIKDINSEHCNIRICGLQPIFNIIPSLASIVNIVDGITFNSCVYSYICEKLGINIEYYGECNLEESFSVIDKIKLFINNPNLISFYWHKHKKKIEKKVNLCYNFYDKNIALYGCRFNNSIISYIEENVKDCVNILPEYFEALNNELLATVKIDCGTRNNFKLTSFKSDNEFEDIAKELIVKNLPLDICEGFYTFYTKALTLTKNWSFKKIYSAGKLSLGGLESHCAAIMRNKGTKIIELQHSAVYGLNEAMSYFERQMYDEFLSWGWESNSRYKRARPICAVRFPEQKGKISKRKHNRILYASNTTERFECGRGANYASYDHKHFDFYKYLNSEKLKHVVCRLVFSSYINPIPKGYLHEYKRIKFEDISECSFADSACRSEVVVCDSYGSTHVEAMILDCPTVFFDGIDFFIRNKQVSDALEELKKVDIFAKDAKAAAMIINNIDDYEFWWNEPERKRAVSKYLSLVAKDYINAAEIWAKEISS